MSKPLKSSCWYLASPYSTPIPSIYLVDYKQERHETVQKIGCELYHRGYILIEPIAMCYYKSTIFNLPQGYEYWKRRDRALIKVCDGVIVATMDGWKDSIGVTDEIQYALRLKKQVWLLDPSTYVFRRYKTNDNRPRKPVARRSVSDLSVVGNSL